MRTASIKNQEMNLQRLKGIEEKDRQLQEREKLHKQKHDKQKALLTAQASQKQALIMETYQIAEKIKEEKV